jgi:hypothetical protein
MKTYDQVLETIPTGPASASVRIQGTDTIICSRITDHFAAEVVRRWGIAPELLEALIDARAEIFATNFRKAALKTNSGNEQHDMATAACAKIDAAIFKATNSL